MKNGSVPDDLWDVNPSPTVLARQRRREQKYVRRLQELQQIVGLSTKMSDTNWNELKLLFTDLVNAELKK